MNAGQIELPGISTSVVIKSLFKSSSGEAVLNAGDSIQAKVVASSPGKAIINLGGLRIPVSTDLALSRGELISLKVTDVGQERVVLRLVQESLSEPVTLKGVKEDLVDGLLKNIGFKGGGAQSVADIIKGAQIDAGKDFMQLKNLIAQALIDKDIAGRVDLSKLFTELDKVMIKSPDRDAIIANIKEMVKAISHEANLLAYLEGEVVDVSNLKLSLLESRMALQTQLQAVADDKLSLIKSSVDKLLNIINATEVLNLPTDLQSRDFIYLPLPMDLGGRQGTAEVKIYMGGSGKKGASKQPSAFSIAFSLDMPSLGKTRAWVEVVDKFINFSISIEDKDGLKEAKKLFPGLKNSLEGLGYQVSRMEAIDVPDEIAESLIEEKMGVKVEGIDLKV